MVAEIAHSVLTGIGLFLFAVVGVGVVVAVGMAFKAAYDIYKIQMSEGDEHGDSNNWR